MTRAARVTVIVILTLCAVVIGAAMVMLSPAAFATTGCVYSGGGWICAGQQPPSEPGELPTVEPMPPVTVEGVENTPPAPEPEPVPEPAPETEPAPAPKAPAPKAPPSSCVP